MCQPCLFACSPIGTHPVTRVCAYPFLQGTWVGLAKGDRYGSYGEARSFSTPERLHIHVLDAEWICVPKGDDATHGAMATWSTQAKGDSSSRGVPRRILANVTRLLYSCYALHTRGVLDDDAAPLWLHLVYVYRTARSRGTSASWTNQRIRPTPLPRNLSRLPELILAVWKDMNAWTFSLD